MLAEVSGMTRVDRTFALAAMPRPRRGRFAAGAGASVIAALDRSAETAILPRRLTVSAGDEAHVTLLLRRRQLVGVAAVAPDALWTAKAALPAPVADDEAGDLVAETAATVIARLMETVGEIDIRFAFPAPGDDTSGEGQAMAALTETLAALLPDGGRMPGRAELLARFYDALGDLPRVILAPERRIDLPENTPKAVRKLFEDLGPAQVKHKPGDAPEILLFESGTAGDALTVKVADEDRLCLAHASVPAAAEKLLGATWQLKRALDQAAAADPDAQP